MLEPLRVEIDYPQARAWPDALRVLVQGAYPGKNAPLVPGWDPQLSDADTYVDPITFTGMLMPAPFSRDWTTTTSGVYTRLGMSDFTITTAAKWREADSTAAGDHWLQGSNLTSDEDLVTVSDGAVDQGYWVSWFDYNPSSSPYEILRCGWGATADYNLGVALRVFSGNRAVVYKDGVAVGDYSLAAAGAPLSKDQQFNGFLLVPTRRVELLAVTFAGGGFSHKFEDLVDEDADPPEIVPAGKFWVQVPVASGVRSSSIQVAKIQYPSSGVLVSKVLSFPDAPIPEQDGPFTSYYGDLYGQTATASVVDVDGSTPFVADSVKTDCRIRLELASDGSASPATYACQGYYGPIQRWTSGPSFLLDPYITKSKIRVGERIDAVSMTHDISRVATAYLDGLADLTGPDNRPIRASLQFEGGTARPISDGVTEPDKWQLTPDQDTDLHCVEAKDLWGLMQRKKFRDAVPFDGSNLAGALGFLIDVGISPDMPREIEDNGFVIPGKATQSTGNFTACAKPGDSCAYWWQRLIDNYAPDWFHSVVPKVDGMVVVACSMATLGDTSALTLYGRAEEAMAALVGEGLDERQARKSTSTRLYHSFREHILPAEANLVYVTGWDPRLDVPIQVYAADYDSQNPTWAPDERPDNWIGQIEPYGWVDTLIDSMELARDVLALLYPRVTVRRRLAEINSGMLWKADGSMIWKGDVLTIDGAGDYRVMALDGEFGLEPNGEGLGTWDTRSFHYVLEGVDRPAAEDAWRGQSTGWSMDKIISNFFGRKVTGGRTGRGAEFLKDRSPYKREYL